MAIPPFPSCATFIFFFKRSKTRKDELASVCVSIKDSVINQDSVNLNFLQDTMITIIIS